MGGDDDSKLHVLFLPYYTPSHMIPLVDAARLFAARGIVVTIIATPYNANLFRASIDRAVAYGHQISIHLLQFPSVEVNLPEGIENFSAVTSPDMIAKVYHGFVMLQKPMEQLIRDLSPDCIFSDLSYPWTVDLAEELNIPRLSFDPSSFLAHCVSHSLEVYKPEKNVQSDSESFLVPGLPNKIEMKLTQLENYASTPGYRKILISIKEAELRSFGLVHNTFYELESAYADHYRRIKETKSWHIGPLFNFPSNKTITNQQHNCQSWLDTQTPKSVLYVAFGTLVRFPDSQLVEIAYGLESSNCQFIWVVKNKAREQENETESWLLKDFEERIAKGNKGMIIKDWAPQSKILNHSSIGGFMTHCGWNSVLEASVAGVPLITWPLFGEQFYNEIVITTRGTGIRVGSDVWHPCFEISAPTVGRDKIKMAITRLMGDSEEAERIKKRAEEMAVAARGAIAEGGSSSNQLTALIEDIKACVLEKKQKNTTNPSGKEYKQEEEM